MNVVELPITRLTEASWNPNHMDSAMLSRLKESISKFGLVGNLVVRPLPEGLYEVLSGNQRLGVLADMGYSHVPCVVVELDAPHARLLAQALNRVAGEDDLGLKAELVREVLKALPQSEVLSPLPESAESLKALVSLGKIDMEEHLRAWQQAQAARLRHMTFQLTAEQQRVVEEAINRVLTQVSDCESNPNRNGNALYLLCKRYLETAGREAR